MKETHLPRCARNLQLVVEPVHLRRIHVIAVQSEESSVFFLEAVVAGASHVEGFVKALIRIVVVANGGVELYARIEQSLVGLLKLPFKVLLTLSPINVVAQH